MDQGSTMKRSAVHNFAPTVTKFCVMWEGQALPHDTKFGNSRCEIVGRRVIFIWSLIHGLRWSGLIKAEPGRQLGENVLTIIHVMTKYHQSILIIFWWDAVRFYIFFLILVTLPTTDIDNKVQIINIVICSWLSIPCPMMPWVFSDQPVACPIDTCPWKEGFDFIDIEFWESVKSYFVCYCILLSSIIDLGKPTTRSF